MSRRFDCAVCLTSRDQRRTCRKCGRVVCPECIGGKPRACLDCTAEAHEGADCGRKGCGAPAKFLAWRFIDGEPCQVLPLCDAHGRAVAGTYALRLIERPWRESA